MHFCHFKLASLVLVIYKQTTKDILTANYIVTSTSNKEDDDALQPITAHKINVERQSCVT